MTTNETFDQITRLTSLYRQLIRSEDEKITSLIGENLERVEALAVEETALLDSIRRIHSEIRAASAGQPLSALFSERDRSRLDRHLGELDGTIRELRMVLLKSRRFVHHSLVHSQGLLSVLFNHVPNGYDGKGDLRAGRGSLRRGMRA